MGNAVVFKFGMLFSSVFLAILATVPMIEVQGHSQILIVGGAHGGVPQAASNVSERIKSSASATVTAGGHREGATQWAIDRIPMTIRNHTRRVPNLGMW